MNINEAFPSKYLKAADLEEGGKHVTITSVVEEEVGRDREMRPIMYFEGEEKGIVLNKTNATNIAKMYGYETEDWVGKRVLLGTAWVDFQGQSTESIRIYPPKRQSANAPLNQSRPQQARDDVPPAGRFEAPPRDLDDSEIPF